VQITLIFYAALEEAISGKPMLLEVPEGITAEQVIEQLSQRFPQVAPILKTTRLAHEDEYVSKQTVLNGGAEYCLIPPVSGG